MFKKILSVALIAMMLVATMALGTGATASAAVTSAGTIYLQVPDSWKTYSTVYCHLWTDGGDDLYNWQSKKEKAKKVSDGLYSYDIPAGSNVNMVIWSNDIGKQTYDLTMGEACLGDTVYSKNEIVENPVDSEKTCELVYWKTHTEYGPKYQESSIGTKIGVTADPEAVGKETTSGTSSTGDKNTSDKKDANSNGSTAASTVPGTGVESNVPMFVGILLAGVAAVAVALISKKKVRE